MLKPTNGVSIPAMLAGKDIGDIKTKVLSIPTLEDYSTSNCPAAHIAPSQGQEKQ